METAARNSRASAGIGIQCGRQHTGVYGPTPFCTTCICEFSNTSRLCPSGMILRGRHNRPLKPTATSLISVRKRLLTRSTAVLRDVSKRCETLKEVIANETKTFLFGPCNQSGHAVRVSFKCDGR